MVSQCIFDYYFGEKSIIDHANLAVRFYNGEPFLLMPKERSQTGRALLFE